MKRKYGERHACARCGHDIEWHGKAHGWIDPGGGQSCLPYVIGAGFDRGEVFTPKGKHTIRPDMDVYYKVNWGIFCRTLAAARKRAATFLPAIVCIERVQHAPH